MCLRIWAVSVFYAPFNLCREKSINFKLRIVSVESKDLILYKALNVLRSKNIFKAVPLTNMDLKVIQNLNYLTLNVTLDCISFFSVFVSVLLFFFTVSSSCKLHKTPQRLPLYVQSYSMVTFEKTFPLLSSSDGKGTIVDSFTYFQAILYVVLCASSR